MGLLQREEMFGAPVAPQTFSDDIATGFDAVVFHGGERLRIAFTVQDAIEDGLAGDAGQITDDVVELNVHLREGLVLMADATSRAAHE